MKLSWVAAIWKQPKRSIVEPPGAAQSSTAADVRPGSALQARQVRSSPSASTAGATTTSKAEQKTRAFLIVDSGCAQIKEPMGLLRATCSDSSLSPDCLETSQRGRRSIFLARRLSPGTWLVQTLSSVAFRDSDLAVTSRVVCQHLEGGSGEFSG